MTNKLAVEKLKELIKRLPDDMPVLLDDGTVGVPPHTYKAVSACRIEDGAFILSLADQFLRVGN
jgi:hypothetical protein